MENLTTPSVSPGGLAPDKSAGQTPPHLAGNIPNQPPSQNQPPQPPPIQPPKIPNPRRRIIVILIVLVLVAATAGYLFYLEGRPKPAAQIGKEQITLEAVANFSRDCVITQNEAVEYIVDEKVLSKWAQDEKIAISQDQQKAEEIRISGKEAALNCIAVQAKVNLLREKLDQAAIGYREGKFIVVNFGRYANPNPIQITEEATGAANRSQKLQEDRAYADGLASSIYADLKEGKLSFEQAIEKVDNDPKVGVNNLYDTTFQSGRFTATDYLAKNGILTNDSVRQKIDSLKEGEISEPFIGQIDVSPCGITDANCNPQYVDSRWIIAKVEKIGKGYENPSEELLAKTRDKYNAKIFIK